jgi:ribonuclease VapC
MRQSVSDCVFDASALLAVLFNEARSSKVVHRLDRALISAVNHAEVVTKLLDRGRGFHQIHDELSLLPLEIVSFDSRQSFLSASMRPMTKDFGLSLGDRACLALGLVRALPVLTTDRNWAKLKVDVEIEVIET